MGGSDLRRNAQLPVDQAFAGDAEAEKVDALLDVATEHELGLDFLLTGSLDAVAATFRVHAFVVDAARDRLKRQSPRPSVLSSNHQTALA